MSAKDRPEREYRSAQHEDSPVTVNAAAILLADKDPQHAALVCGPDTMTYGALRETIARGAAAWRARGLGRGERVAIVLPDSIDWVCAYLSVIWAGGVAVGVNPRIAPDDWTYIAGEGDFRFVLCTVADAVPTTAVDRIVLAAQWCVEATLAAPLPAAVVTGDDPCFWCHSSGSSGRPKAVVHAHRFALQVERVAANLLGIDASDRLFASSKLFFAYPLGNALFAGLKIGATVILDPQWPTAETVSAAVTTHRPTVLFSVPALYRTLLKSGRAPQLAESLRICVSAGEALPASLREDWHKATGITIANGFGASETLSLVLFNRDAGDALAPTPGVRVSAIDGDGTHGPTRVCIAGPMVALGYWNRPDAQAEHFRGGAFVPGDLFQAAGEGTWRFAGREDSLVKINGRWVDLVALEERLALTCFGIREGAVVAAPDADGIAAIAFYYSPRTEVAGCATQCLQRTVAGLPHYQQPRWVRCIPALPRTATGKLLRRKLLELHASLEDDATHVEDA